MKKCNQLIFLFALLLFQSCTLQPDYERPCIELPEEWRWQTNTDSTDCNMRWWEDFQDPALNALIAEALASNKEIKLAAARVIEYFGRLGLAQSAFLPQVNAQTIDFRNQVSRDINFLPLNFPRIFSEFQLLFNASYEVDLWGSVQSASDAALALLFSQVEARRTAVLTLVSAVANTYMLLRQYDDQLEISQNTVKSFYESYLLAKLRFEGGLTSELEVKQSESEVDAAKVQVLQFELLIAEQENLLSILIGHPPQAIVRGPKLAQLNAYPYIPEGIPSEILDQRPDIQQAEYDLIAANANVGVARALLFPQINLVGQVGFQSLALQRLITRNAETWQIGGNINQIIFDGGNALGQIEIADGQMLEAYYAYQQVVLTAFKEVNNALIAHQKAKELVVVQKHRVGVLQDYLKLAYLQYDNGETDYLNVLDAQRNLFSAQLDYAEAQSDVFMTVIAIYKALGGGWVIEADCGIILD